MSQFMEEDGWPVGITKKGWLAKDFDVQQATHKFTARELELLRGLVDATAAAGLAVTEITREIFDHPELRPLFAELVQKLKTAQGLLILSGFPVHECSKDNIWRMYWGIGTHFGIAVSQNTFGQLQGAVTVTPGAVGGRVYGTSAMAPLHSDRIDMLALLCLNKARKRPGLSLHQMLEPGEAVFINNMEMLHSREAFEDGTSPSEKRLLLRLWLQGRPIRPKPRDMTIIRNASGMLGIEPKLRASID